MPVNTGLLFYWFNIHFFSPVVFCKHSKSGRGVKHFLTWAKFLVGNSWHDNCLKAHLGKKCAKKVKNCDLSFLIVGLGVCKKLLKTALRGSHEVFYVGTVFAREKTGPILEYYNILIIMQDSCQPFILEKFFVGKKKAPFRGRDVVLVLNRSGNLRRGF